MAGLTAEAATSLVGPHKDGRMLADIRYLQQVGNKCPKDRAGVVLTAMNCVPRLFDAVSPTDESSFRFTPTIIAEKCTN